MWGDQGSVQPLQEGEGNSPAHQSSLFPPARGGSLDVRGLPATGVIEGCSSRWDTAGATKGNVAGFSNH